MFCWRLCDVIEDRNAVFCWRSCDVLCGQGFDVVLEVMRCNVWTGIQCFVGGHVMYHVDRYSVFLEVV